MSAQTKTIALAVLLLLVVIVVLQNTDSVNTRLLFVTVSMPRAVLIFSSVATGVAIGILVGLRVKKTSEPK
jgi:uncharacterized integral membrane protein